MKSLKEIMRSPSFEDREKKHRAHFLNLLLLLSIPFTLITTGICTVAGWQEGIIASLVSFFLFLISYLLLHLRKLEASTLLFLSTILLAALISAYFGWNIFDSALFLIPILIIISGLLLGKRSFLIFSLSTLILLFFVIMHSWNTNHYLPKKNDFTIAIITTGIFFSITIATTRILIQYLRDSIDESKVNEEKFRTITENLNLGIFTYTDKDEFIYVNDYFCSHMGYPRDELLSKPFIELVHPDHKELVLKRAKDRLNGIEVIDNYEIKVIYKDGSTHWIALSASKVNVQNKILGLGGVFDITRRKDLEQQIIEEKEQLEKAKKLESLGILAGGIAHDFNNLLTGILGNISLIDHFLEDNNTAEIKESLSDVQKVVKRASSLTNQLLTFSKGGSPILKVVSLENIIRENTSFVLSGSNVDYKIHTEPNLWYVNIDIGQISQAIQNLIINANQAMPDGGRIHIKLENIPLIQKKKIHGVEIPIDDYVLIEIKDSGQGIAKKIIHKIFDPYFTTKQKGNGLGLATVYSIIEQHNAYIYVESVKNHGTTFSLYFPKAPKQHIEIKSDISNLVLKTENYSDNPKKILIMDDEKSVQKVAEKMFKRLNFKVDLTNEGDGAIEKFKENLSSGENYDIVLLDLTVPGGMGGKETISHIIKLDPTVFAIATSGYSSDPVLANFELYGFKDIIKKPFSFDEINKIVQRFNNQL
jgi:PAS domain S-box-containing protein